MNYIIKYLFEYTIKYCRFIRFSFEIDTPPEFKSCCFVKSLKQAPKIKQKKKNSKIKLQKY